MAQFLNSINLNNNEIRNFIVQPVASAPITGLNIGRKFFNSTDNRENIYDGKQWLQSAYMSDIVAINNIANGVDERLKAIEVFFAEDSDTVDTAVNKWHEILEFLNATEGDTLSGILNSYALKTRKITAGAGLTGGGDLSADMTISLAEVSGLAAGTYKSVTVDKYGRVTAGTNPNTIAGYGITDAYTKEDIDRLLNGLDVVTVTQTITSGKEIGKISVGTNSTTLFAPASYAWSEVTGKPTTIEGFGITDFTKAKIKEVLGIYDWALASSKPSYKTSEITEDSNLYFTNARAKSAIGLGTNSIGGTDSYIYWTGSSWTTQKLGALAFKDNISASDVGATKKVVKSITAGASTNYTITHGLNTKDVVVAVYDPNTSEHVIADVVTTSATAIEVQFGSAPTVNYKVVIIG